MVVTAGQAWPFELRDGVVRISFDLKVYRLVSIQKAAYKLANQMTVMLGNCEDDRLATTFVFAKGTSEESVRTAMRSFLEELLDQDLRERISEETHAIRSLILAQAFSRTDLIRRE